MIIDMPRYEMPPQHRFESRHLIGMNEEGEPALMYYKKPKLDDNGQPMFEELPDGNGGVKRKPLFEPDDTRPVVVDIMAVQPHGSKDTYEYMAEAFITQCERQGRMPEPAPYRADWAEVYRRNYEAWKQGREPIADGLSVMHWPSIPKAVAEHLVRIGVPTVEQLAAANEQALQSIGTSGRLLKQQAAAYLSKRKTAEVSDLRAQLIAQNETIEKMQAMLAGMQIGSPEPKAEEPKAEEPKSKTLSLKK